MRRRNESGFALLFIFLMAAVVAITLYAEIPRVAFQSQRQKEQLLMERGEQYRRAIQVFFTAAKRWPANLDELGNFQNRHFLRHKYVDPMTGKAEWRVIHVQGGVLTDSVLTKNKDGGKSGTGAESSYISSYAGIGQTLTTGQGSRPWDRRRASEGGTGGEYIPGVTPMPMPADLNQSSDSGQANQPAPGAQGSAGSGATAPGATGATGQQQAGTTGQQQTGTAGQQQAGAPGQQQAGAAGQQQAGATGQQQQQQQQQQSGGGYITAQPSVGAQLPATAPTAPGGITYSAGGITPQGGQASNPALNIIGRILTTPNAQGAAAVRAAQATGGAGGNGIAGVASTAEMEGIMVYNDRTAYNEWEFIFDQTKVRTVMTTGTSNPQTSQPGARTGQSGSGGFSISPGSGLMGSGGRSGTGSGQGGPGGSTPGSSTPAGAGGGLGAGGLPPTVRPGRP